MIAEEKIQNSHTKLFSKEYFETFSAKHSWEPGWLVELRKESWENLKNNESNDLKKESWRFSPRSRFGYSRYNSIADSSNSLKFTKSFDSNQCICDSVDNVLLENPDLISCFKDAHGPSLGALETHQLTNTYFNNGYFIKVPKNLSDNLRIEIEHNSSISEQISFHKNFVTLEDYSELTIIEKFSDENAESNGALSNLTHFKIGKGAKLNRILIQNSANSSSFYNLENFDLYADSSVVNVECYLGANQSRIETKGNLLESGSSFENFSFVSGKSEQLFDQRTEQHHLAPDCRSNLLCKNVLQDESKSIFSGLIRVDPEAQQTNALQTNRNLLLSKEAEADSLPGLEILANDVRCTHGATTSRLNHEELFYLLSRGIEKKHAESLISLGFLEEIIDKIPDENLAGKTRDLVCQHFH